MPPKKEAAPQHEEELTEEQMKGKVVLTVTLESSEPLWAAQDDATLATASIAVGAHEAKASQPMAVNADSGVLPFALTKVLLLEPGLAAVQQLLDSVVTVTFANASAMDAKTQAPLPVTVGTATLDLLPLLSGMTVCGGEVAVTTVPAEAQAATEPGQVTVTPPSVAPRAILKATLREPVVTPEQVAGSTVVSYSARVAPVPAGMVTAVKDTNDPFNVMGAFPWDGQQVTFAGGVLKAGGGGEGDDAAMDAASALVWEGRRFFLPGASARALRDAARAGGCSWDVELARFLRQERAELNDPYFEEYHAAGKLTGLEALLEPGQTELNVTCALTPFDTAAESLLPPFVASTGKATVPDDITDKGSCVWALNSSTLTLTATLSVPLVAKYEGPPAPARTLNELLPKRPPTAAVTPTAAAATAYRAEVKAAVATLADEYVALFGDAKPAGGDTEARRKKLIFELNRSGQYAALKERLKVVVLDLVKAQYVQKPNMSEREVQALYDDVYVSLLNEMHAVLRALQTGGDSLEEPAVPPVGEARLAELSPAKLLSLAEEAEAADETAVAAALHTQRCLVATPGDAAPWYAAGRFAMRNGQRGKAEEAFLQALVAERAHLPSLTALSWLHLADGEAALAETYAREASAAAGADAPGPWLCLSLAYELAGNEHETLNAEWQWKSLLAANPQPLFLDTALELLDLHLGALAEKLLQGEVKSAEIMLCLARAQTLAGSEAGDAEAASLLAAVLDKDPLDARALEATGHAAYVAGRLEEAESAYQQAVAATEETSGVALRCWLRMGSTYLKLGKADDARKTLMVACESYPCRAVWAGLGEAYYRLGLVGPALNAFTEANLLDYVNPRVWGWLALCCLGLEREGEAAAALKQGLKLGLKDAALLTEIGEKYVAMGRAHASIEPLRLAGSVQARCLLSAVLTEQGDGDAAKATLDAAMGDAASMAERVRVLEALLAVCTARGEETEAMRATAAIAELHAEAAAEAEAHAQAEADKFDMSEAAEAEGAQPEGEGEAVAAAAVTEGEAATAADGEQ